MRQFKEVGLAGGVALVRGMDKAIQDQIPGSVVTQKGPIAAWHLRLDRASTAIGSRPSRSLTRRGRNDQTKYYYPHSCQIAEY
jgi:hypothetical protein